MSNIYIPKKLVLVSEYWDNPKGGIGTYVKELTKEIVKNRNLNVKVILKGQSSNKSILSINEHSKIVFSLKCFYKILQMKPDIIHSHGPWYIMLPVILYKKLYPEITIIHTHHTDTTNNKIMGLKRKIMESIYSSYDYNVYVSNYLKEALSYINIKSKKKVIQPGVRNTPKNYLKIKEFKSKYGINENDKIIVYIGNFYWPQKSNGVLKLINSYKDVYKHNSNTKLVIIGDGPQLQNIKNIVTHLNIRDNIIFTGMINDVYSALYTAAVYVHITFQEAFGIAILEAMSCKVPVVASKIGGIPEIIINNYNGILVNNSRDISMNINKILRYDLLRKKLSQNGYISVQENYNWKRISNQYKLLYGI